VPVQLVVTVAAVTFAVVVTGMEVVALMDEDAEVDAEVEDADTDDEELETVLELTMWKA
jgi:hypothetical protein